MTNWLVKKFVKNYTDLQNQKVREQYGMLSSVVGIVCNVLLFLIKYTMGTLANSIAILSDGFNNLSDSASCVITMFGYKMAAKPADKDHPFGHGRAEYLTSLVIAVIIMLVGFELLSSSVQKVMHPEAVAFSWVVLASLVVSVLLKLWMSLFNRTLGNRVQSSVMLATAQDSKNDVIVTVATVIALISALFTDLPVDGVMGVLVSLFVLYSGYGIIKDTVDMLLGQPLDPELAGQLKELVLAHEQILGIHDLIIHCYGPGKMIGSAHVEVSAEGNLLDIHDEVDSIEKEIFLQLHIMMTLHMDPIELNNQLVKKCRKLVERIIQEKDESLSIHDFRVVSGPTHTNLIFDLLIPYESKYSNEEIKAYIDGELEKEPCTYYTVITFDRSYC